MHIGVHEKILIECQVVMYIEYVWNSYFMNTEMLNKIQTLLSGFRIRKPGARGIAEPAFAVRILLLYHLVEIERWREISSE